MLSRLEDGITSFDQIEDSVPTSPAAADLVEAVGRRQHIRYAAISSPASRIHTLNRSQVRSFQVPPPSRNEILQRQLEAEADRSQTPLDALREALLSEAIEGRRSNREKNLSASRVAADVLLVTATDDEHRALRKAALELGFPMEKVRTNEIVYYSLGTIGRVRVSSIQVKTGAFHYEGSAVRCLRARAETGANLVVLLGTAFGVDPKAQRLGDVLVSDSVFVYDRRDIHRAGDTGTGHPALGRVLRWIRNWIGARGRPAYAIRYPATCRVTATEAWVKHFSRASARLLQSGDDARVSVGTILSGGARILAPVYRDEIIATIPASESPIIGGEMEAVGMVSAAASNDDAWMVIKGISDFADGHERHADAALRAAIFVLKSLSMSSEDLT